MLNLADTRADLLLAMIGPTTPTFKHDVAWIAQRSFPRADLYALRAAGLARAMKSIQGARGSGRSELTGRGIAEALRLTDRRVGPSGGVAAMSFVKPPDLTDLPSLPDVADQVRMVLAVHVEREGICEGCLSTWARLASYPCQWTQRARDWLADPANGTRPQP